MIDLGLFDNIIINNSFDAALQELDILFSTKNTELIGNTNYGTNFELFLWDLNQKNDQLENYINQKIIQNTFYLKNIRHTINVESVQDINENIYIVNITLYKDNEDTEGITNTYIIK